MQVLIRKPAWFRWGLWNACHHADGMLEAAAESHSESSMTQLRDRDPVWVVWVVCRCLNLVPKLPSTMTKGRRGGVTAPSCIFFACAPLSLSPCPRAGALPTRSFTVRGLVPMELVISRPLFRWRFFSVLRPNMGTDRIQPSSERVLRCRAHTITAPDTVAQHLQYDVLAAEITHDLFVTTLPAAISKVLEL